MGMACNPADATVTIDTIAGQAQEPRDAAEERLGPLAFEVEALWF